MPQRIVLVHGRSLKPARAQTARLQKIALLQGLRRADPRKAKKVAAGKIPIDFVYFGDINNSILAATDKKAKTKLTARDPHCQYASCVPTEGLKGSIEALNGLEHTAQDYMKIVHQNRDHRYLDDAARAVSNLASLATRSWANVMAITYATADMGAYLTTRAVGAEIRDRLQVPLGKALKRGDDVMLISHSMGCMVAYDVLWKFSRLTEYRHLRETRNRVKWLTLGCPLGEAGVKANLYDSNEYDHRNGTDKYPVKIISDWINVAARDDFIAHDRRMKNDYKAMLKFDFLDRIIDREIYNCYAFEGVANPHKLYGYLANPACAKHITDWIK